MRVFRRVKQQPEHIGRKRRSSDSAGREQVGLRRCQERLERKLDCRVSESGELFGCRRRGAGLALDAKGRHLRTAKLLAPRVREKSIETARNVTQMKSRRGYTPGPRPKLLEREAIGDHADLLAALHQAVRGGHEER